MRRMPPSLAGAGGIAALLAATPALGASYHGSLGVGYESNVQLAADPGATADADDTFTEALGVGLYPLSRGETLDSRFQLSAYTLQYHNLDAFSVTSLTAGPELTATGGAWQATFGVSGTQLLLAGDGFERLATAEAELRHQWSPALSVELAYRRDHVEGLDGYDYLTGSRRRWSLSLQREGEAWQWAAGYERERNDREDRLDAGDFSSYSPVRHTVHAGLTRQAREWRAKLEGEYRYSRYADPNVQSGQSQRRRDHRYQVRARLRRAVGSGLGTYVDATHTVNRSNLAETPFTDYNYVDSYVVIGMEGSF